MVGHRHSSAHGDLKLPQSDRKHEPPAFLSGRFNYVQFGWYILETEAYAILATPKRTHWIAATTEGLDVHTDHNNLILLFSPIAIVPGLSQTALRKIFISAVLLSIYHYACFHIEVQDNVWSDLLRHWSALPTIRRLVRIPVLPSFPEEEFEWRSGDFIFASQNNANSKHPANLKLVKGL